MDQDSRTHRKSSVGSLSILQTTADLDRILLPLYCVDRQTQTEVSGNLWAVPRKCSLFSTWYCGHDVSLLVYGMPSLAACVTGLLRGEGERTFRYFGPYNLSRRALGPSASLWPTATITSKGLLLTLTKTLPGQCGSLHLLFWFHWLSK